VNGTGRDGFPAPPRPAMSSPERISAVLGAAMGHDGPDAAWAARLCQVCVDFLPVQGAAIALMSKAHHLQTVGASKDAILGIEQIQVTLGEGPGVEAFDSRGPVLVPDLGATAGSRWPMFAAALTGSAIGAMFAFPLELGAIRLGVLDLYRHQPEALSGPELATALRVSQAVTTSLLEQGDDARFDEVHGSWLDGSASSREVNQATGMVLAQLDISIEEAYVRLRAYAFSHNRLVADVAADVVARRLRFHPHAEKDAG